LYASHVVGTTVVSCVPLEVIWMEPHVAWSIATHAVAASANDV
jgi:hypothetical protein